MNQIEELLADPETVVEPAFVLFGRRLNAAETFAYLETLDVCTWRIDLERHGERVVLRLHDDSFYEYSDARHDFEASLSESLQAFEDSVWYSEYVSNQARRLLGGLEDTRENSQEGPPADEW